MNRARGFSYLIGLTVLILLGCSTPAEQPPAAEVSAPPAPPAPAVPPQVSVNAEMVALVDHASHELWNVEKQGGAPKNDAAWKEIEHHSIQIAAAGSLIALGGTGQADPGWAQSPDWQMHAQKLTDAGLAAIDAARSKNFEALVAANGMLVESCESCHKQFKPDLPTEGIVHPH